MDDAIFVKKGTNSDIDSYSAFFDNRGAKGFSTGLDKILERRSVGRVWVAGLAIDYCVGGTALDALGLDLLTFVVQDASAVIADDSAKVMWDKLDAAGVILVNTTQAIADMKLYNNAGALAPSLALLSFMATSLFFNAH